MVPSELRDAMTQYKRDYIYPSVADVLKTPRLPPKWKEGDERGMEVCVLIWCLCEYHMVVCMHVVASWVPTRMAGKCHDTHTHTQTHTHTHIHTFFTCMSVFLLFVHLFVHACDIHRSWMYSQAAAIPTITDVRYTPM